MGQREMFLILMVTSGMRMFLFSKFSFFVPKITKNKVLWICTAGCKSDEILECVGAFFLFSSLDILIRYLIGSAALCDIIHTVTWSSWQCTKLTLNHLSNTYNIDTNLKQYIFMVLLLLSKNIFLPVPTPKTNCCKLFF